MKLNISPESKGAILNALIIKGFRRTAEVFSQEDINPLGINLITDILESLDDTPLFFPKGKWATIQVIQDQLNSYYRANHE